MSQMWFKLALKAGQTSPWILVGEDAMSDEERELTGGEIQRFVELQAAEGKTAGEALEALLRAVGGRMPEFKNE